ncbi:MAG: FAD:protein FMN transferase [Gemmataceae bacterium]|nr:FAD:protein FMN transferase [Gemmataceae bacterium]
MLLDFLLADEPNATPGEYTLVRVSRRAMATTFEIALPVHSHPNAVAAAEDALDLIDALEDQLTVYREHSEVSRLNETACGGFVEVEPHLFDLLARCAVWTKETAGAFDIATGALVKAWGFFRREPRVPPPRELNEAVRRSGFRHVVLDAARAGVKFRAKGLELNLGAVGKGYALDRAAELLRGKWGVRSALLHAGGSSARAIGSPPGDGRGWPIRLRHPTNATESLGTAYLRDAGLGTSAATFQFFEYNGRKLGHLLDPRRGWPAEGTLSASVTAPTAAEADAMSTAAFVLGAGFEPLASLRPALGAVVLEAKEPTPAAASLKGRGEQTLPTAAFGATPSGSEVSVSPLPERKGAAGVGLHRFNLPAEAYSPPDHPDLLP